MAHPALALFDAAVLRLQAAYADALRDGRIEDVQALSDRIGSLTARLRAMMDGIEARLADGHPARTARRSDGEQRPREMD